MKVRIMCRKFECRKHIHYKTQTGFDSQPEGLGVAFFATGPGLGLIMYMFTTLEFPTHYSELSMDVLGIL